MLLEKFPNASDFYKHYWNKKPFVVKGAIPKDVFAHCISGDELAGLALEEDVKSRIVTTAPQGGRWTCEFGPFEGDKFATLGDKNWNLLVQNVDEYHEGTSALLEHFAFSPRWLMDDIMVSYSTTGGTVGAHTDSYHVFLVQGMGTRTWTLGTTPLKNLQLIEGLDLKVLKHGAGADAQTFEVRMGDVIYIPPHFAHEGTTIDTAMTFSVGFLGPQLSEMLIEYGYHLTDNEVKNPRYEGQGLDESGAGDAMPADAKKTIQDMMLSALNADDFDDWVVDYFAED